MHLYNANRYLPAGTIGRSDTADGRKQGQMTKRVIAWLTGKNPDLARAYDFIAEPPIWRKGWFLLLIIAIVIVILFVILLP